MQVYAHRGWSSSFPENTLLAFLRALDTGVTGIELDVHATADGTPVVIHDRSLARTTDGTGLVDELPLSAVLSLDAGSGERIPLLADVLQLVGTRVHLDIELKGLGIELPVLEVLARFPDARWAISSFNWDTLRRLRSLKPNVELWPLAEECDLALFSIASELDSPAVSLYAANYTAASAETLRGASLAAVVWTVNDPAEAKRVRDLGAFALCTDAPDVMIAALDG